MSHSQQQVIFPYNPEMTFGPAMMGPGAMFPPMGPMGYPLIPPPGAYPSPPQGSFKSTPPPPGFGFPPMPPPGLHSPPPNFPLMPPPRLGSPSGSGSPLGFGSPPGLSFMPFNNSPISFNENQRPAPVQEQVYRDEARRLSVTNLVLEPVETCNNTVIIVVNSAGKTQVSTIYSSRI